MVYRNIIVMGYSGAGKDTAGRLLTQMIPGSKMVKFCDLPKQALADYYGISRDLMEDRAYRENQELPDLPGKTYLQFLIDAYHVFRVMAPEYWVEKTMKSLPSCTRIFTDVRSPEEGKALKDKLISDTLVIWLHRKDAVMQTSDRYQDSIYAYLSQEFDSRFLFNNSTIESLNSSLKTLVNAQDAASSLYPHIPSKVL